MMQINTFCWHDLNIIDSTQYAAKNYFSNENINGETVLHQADIFFAEEQTAGRGRYGRSFYSPKGGIYFTLTFRAELCEVTKLTLAMAVSLQQILSSNYSRNCSIKWVNDLYFHKKKVCGILSEVINSCSHQSQSRFYVGVGINLKLNENPLELEDKIGDVNLILSKEEKKSLIEETCHNLFEWLNCNDEKLMDQYRKNLLGIGYEACMSDGTQGIILGVDLEGKLLLKTKKGILSYSCGEVSLKNWRFI